MARKFTTADCLRILDEYDAAPHGAKFEILIRERVTSSYLAAWRKRKDVKAAIQKRRDRARRECAKAAQTKIDAKREQARLRDLEQRLREKIEAEYAATYQAEMDELARAQTEIETLKANLFAVRNAEVTARGEMAKVKRELAAMVDRHERARKALRVARKQIGDALAA